MKIQNLHPFSLLAGALVAAIGFVAMSQVPAPVKPQLDYKVVEDPKEQEIQQLANDGWEYAGYLGQGVKGGGNDQTLWKRCK